MSAAMATPKRPPEASPEADAEGFVTVRSKRARRRARTDDPAPAYIPAPSGILPEWRIAAVGAAFRDRYRAIRWMEEERQLRLRVTVSPAGDFVIRAWDWSYASALEHFALEQPEGICIVKKEPAVKGVLLGYPVHLPLDPIQEHPAVAAAERCSFNAGRGRRLPTRSVQLTLRVQLPSSLDLGCWGRFACRRYVPEPLRCFRCQAFGHHQRNCSRKEDLCGVCSGDHSTRDCLLRLRDGKGAPAPLCVNCGAGHYAWYRRCPARLRRIPGAVLPPRDTAERSPRPPPPVAPAAAADPGPRTQEGGRRRRRRRRGKGRTTGERPRPPSSPVRGEKVAPPRPRDPSVETETRAEAPKLEASSDPPAKTRKKKTAVGAGAVAKEPRTTTTVAATDSRRCGQSTQTGRCFVFSEAELVDLLIRHEHLLVQESEARTDRIPHEPALSCTRRHVREGRQVPITLPMAQPLAMPPRFRDHRGEGEWVDYDKQEMAEEDEDLEDLLYEADRDLTDEEFARLCFEPGHDF